MAGFGRRLDNKRWKAVSPYFDRAMDLNDEERASWLSELRRQDRALANDLEQLLEDHRVVVEERFLEDVSFGPESMPGCTVGAYRLIAPIGQGGMGTVWLAERADGRFEARAAVKLLNLSLMGGRSSRAEQRFKREGSLLARLTHPNIARLIDAGVTSAGQPFLILEHVDGQPIDRYCDERALGVDARIRLFIDVLAAVAHAHANLVVHRDLKPSNVLVTDDGHVKLLDFGIAKLLHSDEGSALTKDGAAALTPEFAAPEQVTGHQVTTATDVYSLGVLLYLLLGGQHPTGFGFRSPADLVKAIVDTDPPRLSDAVTSLTPETQSELTTNAGRRATTPERLRRVLKGDLDTIVAKTLKKNASERYPSVTALADDLRRYLARQPIGARPDTWGYRTATFIRRNARGVLTVAGVAALIVSVVGFYTVRLATERDRARMEAQKAATVSDLMTELLTGADPFRDRPDPTVRELLDAGAERVQRELARDPEILAEMLTAMGRVYQRLDINDKARPLLERALELGRGIKGPEHPRLAQTLNDLGVLTRMTGDAAGSIKFLEEALALRLRLLGPKHKDIAVTLSELGRSYDDVGDAPRAEALARESLAMRREVLGEQHRETATSMSDVGLLLWQRGDLDGAEPMLRQSLEISRAVLGEYHANVGTALSNLGLVVGEKGNYPASEALFRQAIDVRSRVFGVNYVGLAVNLNNLAFPLREQGKFAEAIEALQRAVALSIPAKGDDSAIVANYRANLGRVYLAKGDAASAEPLLRRALSSRLRAFNEQDWRVAMTKSLLGSALTSLRRYDEAETLLLDAARVLKDVPGPQGREAKATRIRLTALYEARGTSR